MKKLYRCLIGFVLLGMLLAAARPAPRALAAAPEAGPAAPFVPPPSTLVNEPFSDWTVGGYFLYWSRCESSPNLPSAPSAYGYLRRVPGGFGSIAHLSNSPFCVSQLAADDSGIYGYMANGDIITPVLIDIFHNRVVHHTIDAPILPLVLAGGRVYWASPSHIYRVNQDGNEAVTLAVTGGSPSAGPLVMGDNLVWLADGALRMAPIDCDSLPCSHEQVLVAANGNALVRYGEGVVWVDYTTQPYTIRRLNDVSQCYANAICDNTQVYTPTLTGTRIGGLAISGSELFFVENECNPVVCTPTAGGRLRHGNANSHSAITIAEDLPNWGDKVYVDNHYVYYEKSPSTDRRLIARLPLDAQALVHDLRADAWEVTQGTQRLINDVALVANKPTFVRVYGKQWSGPRANTVEVRLYGWRNGLALPGSPLSPLDGSQPLSTGVEYFRPNADAGWLFELPAVWTNAGPVTLQAQLDPRGIYDDPNRSNNALPNGQYPKGTFNFLVKSAVCIVAIPVRTHGPVATSSGPSFAAVVSYMRRVWPTSQVWTYKQSDDIAEREFTPFPTFGPYEMPEDAIGVLESLTLRDIFSDDPDECDNNNARTHYIGIISPETLAGLNGKGRMGNDQALISLPPANIDPTDLNSDSRMNTLAHELGHNYGRGHVACGDPDTDSIDYYYPYPVCELDTFYVYPDHVGFDTLTRNPIDPSAFGDLMSYAHRANPRKPRWISDYTWTGLLGDMPIPSGPATGRPAVSDASVPELANVPAIMLVVGSVTPSLNQGSLEPAWVFPSASLSSSQLRKWQAIAAPAAPAGQQAPAAHTYHLRLLDSALAVLDDRAVTPGAAEDSPEQIFSLTFPAPAGAVARIELLDGSTLLASLQPGSHAPTVSLTQPSGGQSIQNDLTVSWQAADGDADMLVHTIQYSPDGGATWRVLVTNYPHNSGAASLPLHLAGLPGNTSNALIRVAVSDGLHTTLATSQPFQVANHAPDTVIYSPALGQAIPAGQPILLQGAATDPEDGGVPDINLSWSLDGAPLGTGADLTVDGLAPGTYTVTLTAHDAQNLQQSVSASLMVGVLSVPLGTAPALDGECDDDAYAGAAQVQLAPFIDGSQGTARLVRTATDLWLCFSGMPRSTGDTTARAGLHLDANNSRDALLQTGDFDFYVGEDGTPASNAGDGAGNFSNPGPAGVSALTSANTVVWNAELRVPAGLLGGWGHVVGMDLGEYWVQAFADDYHWPHRAAWNAPVTWARVALGDIPWINSLSPTSAAVGAAFELTVTGTGFAPGATVRWNGSARPTTFVSSTVLRAQISAANTAAAGLRPVSVVNPGLEAAPSNPAWFAVLTPFLEAAAGDIYRLFLPLVGR